LNKVKNYFTEKLEQHGATHRGVDYNSTESQHIRFHQLIKVIDSSVEYSLLDFGSGYGGMYDYLRGSVTACTMSDMTLQNQWFKGREMHPNDPELPVYRARSKEVPMLDYAVVSGTFNMKLDADFDVWTQIVIESLEANECACKKGACLQHAHQYTPMLIKCAPTCTMAIHVFL
jgi:hypothetical protein